MTGGMFSVLAQTTNMVDTIEQPVVGLLSVAVLVAVVARRIKMPYTVALVLAGLALALTTVFEIRLSRDLILGVLVPPLLFNAAMHLPWHRLKTDLWSILMLAIGGTLAGTFLTAAMIFSFVDVAWPAALAFGALAAATDPVAVVARFRSMGMDRRLNTLLEGESLLNDGLSIVLFGLATAGGAGLMIGSTAGRFLWVSLGALMVGVSVGYLVAAVLLKNLDDHLIETVITLVLAFGVFQLAGAIGVNGNLAVVGAGIMIGEIGLKNASPNTRLGLESFWEMLTFIVNAVVFLLVGLRIEITFLFRHVTAILVAVAAALLVRLVVVYGSSFVLKLIPAARPIPRNFQHVIYWGGMRGAVSLALALTLPFAFDPDTAEILQVMTFGLVLFTLLVQSTTIKRLARKVGIVESSPVELEYQRRRSRQLATRAGRMELKRLYEENAVQPYMWRTLDDLYRHRMDENLTSVGFHMWANPELETEMVLRIRTELLKAERTGLLDAARRGLISDEIAESFTSDLANRLAAIDFIRARMAATIRGRDGA